MVSEGRVQQNTDVALAEGAQATVRLGKSCEIMASDASAKYQDLVRRGLVFYAANTAAQATSVNSGTATGLVLFNPTGSGKLLVLLEVCVALASLPAGAAPLVLTGSVVPPSTAVTHTAALTINNALLGGGGKSVAFADSSATIPTPAVQRAIGGGPAATVATGTSFPPMIKDQVDGAIILAPGSCISLQSLTTAISVVASMTWAEVPIGG